MALEAKPQLETLALHMKTQVQVPDALLPIQVPANVLGERTEDDSSTWAAASMWEIQTEFLASGAAVIWDMDKQIKEFLSSLLPPSAF